MASGYTAIDGRDTDVIFAPYSSGTKPSATGFFHANGQDFSNVYQPGNSGVVTGYKISSGADIGSIFAAPSSSLPINGGTYTTTLTRDGTSGARASVKFVISGGNAWALQSTGLAGQADPGIIFASGSLPVGSVNVEFTTANPTGTAQTQGTTGTQIAVSSNPTLEAYVASAGTIGTANGSIQVTVVFYNSGGTAISTTTYTADMVIQN